MTGLRDKIVLDIYKCVRRRLKDNHIFLYISNMMGGESEIKLEVIDYVDSKVESIMHLFDIAREDNRKFKSIGKSYAFTSILYSMTVAKLEALSEESMLKTDIDMFKELFESCYGEVSGFKANEVLKRTANCDYDKLNKLSESVLKTVTDLCIHNYVYNYLDKSYVVIKHFIDDYEYSLKLSGRPKTKENKANAYFMSKYNITYSQAADIYNSYGDYLMLYNVLSEIIKKKHKKIEEMKKKPREERIVLKKFGNKLVEYCSKGWIEEKIKARLEVLKALQEKYPKHYTDEYIKKELNNYRKYLNNLCKSYKR